MSVTYSRETSLSGESAAYGGFVDALGGIATIVLAIIALSGVQSQVLLSIATIVFGAALLIQGGAMLTEFAQIEITAEEEATAAASGGGLSALFLVGVAGIVLGVLALMGVHALMLDAIAAIAFGGALIVSASAVWQLLTSRSMASRFQTYSSMLRVVAAQVTAGSSVIQGIAGLAVIVLGILAVAGINGLMLTLVALLTAGAAIVLTGSTLSGAMIGFMRSTPPARTGAATHQVG